MSKYIKIITLIMLISGAIFLTGCGKKPADKPADNTENNTNATPNIPAAKPTINKPGAQTPKTDKPVTLKAYTATGTLNDSTITHLFGGMKELDGLTNSIVLNVSADGSVEGKGVVVIDFKPESKFGNGKDGRMDMVFSGTTEGSRIGGIVVTTGQDTNDKTGEVVFSETVNMGWVAEKSGNKLNIQIYALKTKTVTMEFTATIK